jgi:hypothetical protein
LRPNRPHDGENMEQRGHGYVSRRRHRDSAPLISAT